LSTLHHVIDRRIRWFAYQVVVLGEMACATHRAGGAFPCTRLKTLSEHSYGFRPRRFAHQAVAQPQRSIADGDTVVVDLDLESLVQVNHDSLMARVAARVSDKRMIKLIRAFLNAGVMVDGLVSPMDEGTAGRKAAMALRACKC
jgi:hypothetical protein